MNYVGAGTVEFIVEQPGGYAHPEQMKFFFMEMNTRLQVGTLGGGPLPEGMQVEEVADLASAIRAIAGPRPS